MINGLPTHTVFLSLGTNLGDRRVHLKQAIEQIGLRMGAISSVSSVYETSPWGFESPHPFLNMAVKVRTRLNPFQILYISQAIERELGRMEKSSGVYQDRIIDIDLIMYDQLELDTPQLKLPHPLYKERDFVMRPLSEIL